MLAAEKVPKADKLLKLSVDLGEVRRAPSSPASRRPTPRALIGRNVVVVANLKPRALKGVESKGMLLAGGAGGEDPTLVDPGALVPGTLVK